MNLYLSLHDLADVSSLSALINSPMLELKILSGLAVYKAGELILLSMNSLVFSLLTVFAKGIGVSDSSGREIPHRHLGCEHFGAVEMEDCTISRQK